MATGISKFTISAEKKQKNAVRQSVSAEIVLQYEGKKPQEVILATPTAHLEKLWPNDNCEEANRLFYGDNLNILSTLLQQTDVCGKVRLVYIDPPFATKMAFQSRSQSDAYADLLSGAHYLEFLRERLVLLRELLSEDGSIYVHLDERMAFQCKIVMDEVFGARNYRNWITRKKCNPKNYTRKSYGNVSDFILFYSKSENYVWNRPIDRWTPERIAKEYEYVDGETGKKYKKVPIHAPGVRNGATGKSWRGMNPPPGKHWQYVPETLDELDKRGHIYWSANGNPRRKVFLDESGGVPVQDLWLDCRDAYNQNIRITGYPTEKNPEMLRRIIEASSNERDLVLDAFSGSGTTLAAASQLNRSWIGIDDSSEAVATTLRRFSEGTAAMGDFVRARNELNAPQNTFNFETNGNLANNATHGNGAKIESFGLYASTPAPPELRAAMTEFLPNPKA